MRENPGSQASQIHGEVLEAEKRCRPFIRKTPVEYSHDLSRIGTCGVHLKLESSQITGSFKIRGAANKILSLTEEERNRGIVTASSGNHGAAVAYMMKALGCGGAIILPKTASGVKIDALRRMGTPVEIFGDDCVEAEAFAREKAEKHGMVYVSPYNDIKIIGGQGTVAKELAEQVKAIDSVLVPVGGGGLISGVGGYLKALDPSIDVIGCQPQNSAVMFHSIRAGKILEMESLPTLSDGTAGGIEQGSLTFGFCKALVDDFILVGEEAIKEAVKRTLAVHHILVEGAAALTIAAFIKESHRFQNKAVALVISGSKIALETLKSILCNSGG